MGRHSLLPLRWLLRQRTVGGGTIGRRGQPLEAGQTWHLEDDIAAVRKANSAWRRQLPTMVRVLLRVYLQEKGFAFGCTHARGLLVKEPTPQTGVSCQPISATSEMGWTRRHVERRARAR